MKNWIRRWLGLDVDQKVMMADHAAIINYLARIEGSLFSARSETRAISSALGRIVAKLDPTFVKSEFDQDRKAESDRLGEEAIKRLKAEDWARRHTEGFPDATPK